MKKKHYSRPHNVQANIFLAASQVEKKMQKEVDAAATDNWLKSIGVGVLCFRELTGDNKKTERFASRYAEMLQEIRDHELTTADVLEQVQRYCGIELMVEDEDKE